MVISEHDLKNLWDIHHQRIQDLIASKKTHFFKLTDTCRLDNGGIVKLPQLSGKVSGYAAFIPAAGAATRYRTSLMERGAELAPGWDKLPKALLPCVREGQTFLELKYREHAALDGIDAHVFVCSPTARALFDRECQKLDTLFKSPAVVLEQGRELSTPRILADGTLVREPDGTVSLAPAGHGSLALLMPTIREKTRPCHSLLIRTVDNIMGLNPQALDASRNFLRLHTRMLEAMRIIRSALRTLPLTTTGEAAAQTLLELCGQPPSPLRGLELLAHVQAVVFHSPNVERGNAVALRDLYERPFNALGMVPNTGKDVGGAPAFCKTPLGLLKLCIELPHVAPDDRQNFLENSRISTHFNPVFVAAELPLAGNPYQSTDHHFWIIAQKADAGRTVYYCESLLFEILGNSAVANCVFVEMPRCIFNPHKTVADAEGRSFSHWIPAPHS